MYYQPVPETIFWLPPQPHGSVPLLPPPRQSEIFQTNQQPHADEFSAMTQGNRVTSIMVSQNEQASLRSINTNGRNISSMHNHKRVGSTKLVTEPAPNSTSSNESYINLDTFCLVQNVIPIAYTKQSAHFW